MDSRRLLACILAQRCAARCTCESTYVAQRVVETCSAMPEGAARLRGRQSKSPASPGRTSLVQWIDCARRAPWTDLRSRCVAHLALRNSDSHPSREEQRLLYSSINWSNCKPRFYLFKQNEISKKLCNAIMCKKSSWQKEKERDFIYWIAILVGFSASKVKFLVKSKYRVRFSH